MSQAKVDRYKEEKKNRKKIMAKEKRMRIAGYVAGCLVAAGIIGWAGYSGYSAYEASKPMETIYALNKHIVSFGAAKCKRNTCSLLAVIFIPKIRKDGTYGTKKETPKAPKWVRINKISRQRTL